MISPRPLESAEKFRSVLLERWEREGKNPDSFDTKVWHWLTGSRLVRSTAERYHLRSIRNWAFSQTRNQIIHSDRKQRGYSASIA